MSQFCATIYSMKVTSNECLSRVQSLLGCPDQIDAVRSFQGNEARKFIDFLDQVVARSYLDDKFRQRSLLLLSKICRARGVIPASYTIRLELVRIGQVSYQGGFGDVYDGEYLGLPVAVKRLRMYEGDRNGAFKRGHWLETFIPSNILPLLGVSVPANAHSFYIITEWMFNGNITQYTKSNPKANRLQLLSEVTSGVAYLHNLKIVHGDLKGANVLVDDRGTARITDFGLMTMSDLSTILLSETIASPGGTIPWMSPELLDPMRFGSNGHLSRESDRYALGMVIYEILTGLPPFYHMPGYSPAVAVLRGERPERPPNSESLGLSDVLWRLLQSCWSESRSTRPTAQQLFDYLTLAALAWVPPSVYPIIPINAPNATGVDSYSSLGVEGLKSETQGH